MKEKKLVVENLNISFRTQQGLVHAVRGVGFELEEGETLAIVGESGSGKSVTSRAIMGILAGNAIIEDGQIMYENQDLTRIPEEEFHKIRGTKIGMIFQDPMSSLNPIMRIGKQITEGMIINGHHLKNKFKDLVHHEKMLWVRHKVDLADLITKYKEDKSKLKEQKASAQEIAALKSKHLAEKEKLIKETKALEKDYKDKIPAAKQEVKAYWQEQKAIYNNKISALTDQIKQLPGKSEEKTKLIEKRAEEKEALRRVKRVTKKEAIERALKVMDEVGIPEPEKRIKQYPFQFSGGMRQRIVVAIALTANPDVLICDEPTTALDVTIQAQILELIKDLKRLRNLTVIFITHDLGVVANMADRVAVMYAGKIVEIGTVDEIFYDPQHPYTWALLGSMPDLNSTERLTAIPGTPPNMLYPPKGDAFADRSSYAMQIDYEEQPPYFEISKTHYAATWLLHPDAPKVKMPKIVSDRIKVMKDAMKKGVSK
jgi:oligopeptide transport system ATP-binding protein